MLAPYLHSKNATKPIAPDPVYFEQAVTLTRPTTIREAYENILKLSEMKAQAQLDVATADSLITDQHVVLNAMVDEAKLLAANADPNAPPVIRIEGGLPPLSGTEIIMPQLNGHKTIDEAGNLIPDQQAQSTEPSLHFPAMAHCQFHKPSNKRFTTSRCGKTAQKQALSLHQYSDRVGAYMARRAVANQRGLGRAPRARW